MTVYAYIVMERTQIYLDEQQTAELDRRARKRGTTRSHLIREALEQYLAPAWDPAAFTSALHDFAGIWADRDDLVELVADLRERDRARLARLWSESVPAEDRSVTDR